MKQWEKKVISVAENLDFDVTHHDDYWCFSKSSPAGQDFNIEMDAIHDFDELLTELQNRYKGYDVSYEAYLWLDNTGHGANGAPYDMKDVYEDMEWCETQIHMLAMDINQILRR